MEVTQLVSGRIRAVILESQTYSQALTLPASFLIVPKL